MRITRPGYGRPPSNRSPAAVDVVGALLWAARTAALVSLTGMFVSGAHDTFRWVS